jgi:hypothetical protein
VSGNIDPPGLKAVAASWACQLIGQLPKFHLDGKGDVLGAVGI